MELQFAVTDRDAFAGGRGDQRCPGPAHPLRDLERQAPPDDRKEDDEQAAPGPTHPSHRHVSMIEEGRWSGRPDSNRRRQAWEACILPLNYARTTDTSTTSARRFATGRHAVPSGPQAGLDVAVPRGLFLDVPQDLPRLVPPSGVFEKHRLVVAHIPRHLFSPG